MQWLPPKTQISGQLGVVNNTGWVEKWLETHTAAHCKLQSALLLCHQDSLDNCLALVYSGTCSLHSTHMCPLMHHGMCPEGKTLFGFSKKKILKQDIWRNSMFRERLCCILRLILNSQRTTAIVCYWKLCAPHSLHEGFSHSLTCQLQQ